METVAKNTTDATDVDLALVRERLRAILAAHPALCWRGFEPLEPYGRTTSSELAELRKETLERADRIVWAAWWCDRWLEPARKLARRSHPQSSYVIKHLAELESPWRYVGSGEITLTAMLLGWPVERIEDGPNSYTGVSIRSVKAVQKRLGKEAS